MQQNHKAVVDACASIEKKMAQKDRETDSRFGAMDKDGKENHKQLSRRCEALEKTVASETSASKARAEKDAQDAAAARAHARRATRATSSAHRRRGRAATSERTS